MSKISRFRSVSDSKKMVHLTAEILGFSGKKGIKNKMSTESQDIINRTASPEIITTLYKRKKTEKKNQNKDTKENGSSQFVNDQTTSVSSVSSSSLTLETRNKENESTKSTTSEEKKDKDEKTENSKEKSQTVVSDTTDTEIQNQTGSPSQTQDSEMSDSSIYETYSARVAELEVVDAEQYTPITTPKQGCQCTLYKLPAYPNHSSDTDLLDQLMVAIHKQLSDGTENSETQFQNYRSIGYKKAMGTKIGSLGNLVVTVDAMKCSWSKNREHLFIANGLFVGKDKEHMCSTFQGKKLVYYRMPSPCPIRNIVVVPYTDTIYFKLDVDPDEIGFDESVPESWIAKGNFHCIRTKRVPLIDNVPDVTSLKFENLTGTELIDISTFYHNSCCFQKEIQARQNQDKKDNTSLS